MAKVNAPLMGFSAGGQIGKSVVFSKWRGVPYARQYTAPGNPNTTDQQSTRNTFTWLNAVYKLLPSAVVDAWTATAKGRPLINRNAFIKANLPYLRGQSDLTNFNFSTGANGGLPPASVSVTPGSGQLAVTVTAPAAPTGWTVTAAHVAVIRDQDPATGTYFTTTYGTDASAPYSVTLTGLTGSQAYRVGAWLEWTKPDGTSAYSAASMTSGTPS